MMNNMDANTISNILIIVLSVMFFILLVLVAVFVGLKAREKSFNNPKKQADLVKNNKNVSKTKNNTTNVNTSYTKQSIMNFMEFDKVEDNMIVQKKGKRYLMVVECQGVNYDLMSNMEKVAVEEGFQQFLNTLRHPIQIYIQTRTINLEENINRYKERIRDLEQRYNRTVYEYRRMQEAGVYSDDEMKKYYYEVTKQKNLLD